MPPRPFARTVRWWGVRLLFAGFWRSVDPDAGGGRGCTAGAAQGPIERRAGARPIFRRVRSRLSAYAMESTSPRSFMRDYLLTTDPVVASAQGRPLAWCSRRTRTAALNETATLIDRAEDTPMRKSSDAGRPDIGSCLDFIADMRRPGNQWQRQPGSRRRTYFTAELGRTPAQFDASSFWIRLTQMSARELAASNANLNANFDSLRLRLILMLAATLGAGWRWAVFTVRRTLKTGAGSTSPLRRRRTRSRRIEGAFRAPAFRAGGRATHHFARAARRSWTIAIGIVDGSRRNAAATVPAASLEVRKTRRIDQEAGRGQRQRHPQHDLAAAARRMLDDFGLVPALEWQARESVEAHRTACARHRRGIGRRAFRRN